MRMTTETESLGIVANLMMLIETFRTAVMKTIESDDRRSVNLDLEELEDPEGPLEIRTETMTMIATNLMMDYPPIYCEQELGHVDPRHQKCPDSPCQDRRIKRSSRL